MFRALFCPSSVGQNCIIQRLVSSHSVGGHRCTERPPTGVMIPDAVQYSSDLPMMSTIVLETCRGI